MPKTLEFVTGYVVEESLSIDNLFVFLVLFRHFRVASEYQHKVLTWGIIGALVMRGVFIVLGVTLLGRFHWIVYLFGAFLLYTGAKLLRSQEEEVKPEHNWALRLAPRFLPFTSGYRNGSLREHPHDGPLCG